MTFIAIVLLASVLAAIGVFMAVWSFSPRGMSEAELAQARLQSYSGTVLQPGAEQPREPFRKRVLEPAVRAVTQSLGSRLPAATRAEVQRRLAAAGRPLGLTAEQFTILGYVIAVLLVGAGLGLGVIINQPLVAILIVIFAGVVAIFGPVVTLRYLARRRAREIESALPNAMDLLSVSVEAGLGFDAAMARLCEQYHNALTREFEQVLAEIRLGRPRAEALDDMGRRAGVTELHHFVQAVIQSQQMGTAIAAILRQQSDEVRRARRQRAQELGARAPLKMLIPMLTCIFPTLWVLLLGPALLTALGTLRGLP